MKKRILSILLSIIMLPGMLPVTALPASAAEQTYPIVIERDEYTSQTTYSEITFDNCYAVNCSAGGNGGFMYINDSDAKVYGKDNTVISGCSAKNGGGMLPATGPQPLATPTADDFNFIPPVDCVYDGQPKQATVYTVKEGMGVFTLKYQKKNGSGWDTATTDIPTEIGKYRVVISVEKGTAYAASAADITNDSWVFEITAPPCTHENTTVFYKWNDTYTECTAAEHCDDCNEDIQTETAAEIKLIEDTHGANCKTKGKGHYEATFATLGTAETASEFDTTYGDHHYVDYVCEYCGDELFGDAQKDAIKAIDYTADHSDDEAIKLLAETAKEAIDDSRSVAEILKIKNLTISQISAIKTIITAAGNSTNRTVKAAVIAAKTDICSAESIEDVANIRDECLAAIEKLTGTTHEHTFSTEYSKNEFAHWYAATCEHDVVTGLAVHTFGEGVVDANKTTYTCTACGYERVETEDETAKLLAEALAALNKANADLDAAKKDLANKDEQLEKAAKDLAAANAKAEQAEKDLSESKAEAAELTEKLNKANDDLDKANAALDIMMDEKTELEELLKAKEVRLEKLNAQTDAQAAEIASLNSEIEELNGQIADKDAQITAKENEITSLKAKISAYEKTIADLQAQIDAKQATINSLNAQLDAAKKEIERLKAQGGNPGTDNTCSKCGKVHADNFVGKITCFFNRIINWFRNLFS